MKPLADQVACAKRELSMRRRVYPRWVSTQRMTQAAADHEIACMEAIVATLEAMAPLKPEQGALLSEASAAAPDSFAPLRIDDDVALLARLVTHDMRKDASDPWRNEWLSIALRIGVHDLAVQRLAIRGKIVRPEGASIDDLIEQFRAIVASAEAST